MLLHRSFYFFLFGAHIAAADVARAFGPIEWQSMASKNSSIGACFRFASMDVPMSAPLIFSCHILLPRLPLLSVLLVDGKTRC